jgi:hypothetical protein
MSDPYEDFIKGMPLTELERFIAELGRKFGVTDAELEQWRRLSHAERIQRMDALIAKMRCDLEGRDA